MKLTLQPVQMLLVVASAPSASASEALNIDANVGVPFELPVGATANFGLSMIWVRFDEMLNDSRCPKGVICFWEGSAYIAVSASRRGEILTMTLYTLPEELSKTDVFEYCLILNKLDPYPDWNDGGPQACEYVATLTLHSGNCGESPSNNSLEDDSQAASQLGR